jgi:hypothetical protein
MELYISSLLGPDILSTLFAIAAGHGVCYSTRAIPTAVFSNGIITLICLII